MNARSYNLAPGMASEGSLAHPQGGQLSRWVPSDAEAHRFERRWNFDGRGENLPASSAQRLSAAVGIVEQLVLDGPECPASALARLRRLVKSQRAGSLPGTACRGWEEMGNHAGSSSPGSGGRTRLFSGARIPPFPTDHFSERREVSSM